MCSTCGKFIDQPYAGSICQTTIASCAGSKDGLRRYLLVSESAVRHHAAQGNACQVAFFSEAVNHVEKLLKPFDKRKSKNKNP